MNRLGPTLFHHGLSQTGAARQACARIYQAAMTPATVQSYIDAVWIFGLLCLAMVPLAVLL